MTGFTFPYRGKDVFVNTERKNKSQRLASLILRKMLLPDNPDTRAELLYCLQKAECDINTLTDGRRYYEIHGENFGGKGSFVGDGNTIIINI